MILEKIKDETLDNHVRLERSRLLLPISRQEIDRNTYQPILNRFYSYFQSLEALIDNFPTVRDSSSLVSKGS